VSETIPSFIAVIDDDESMCQALSRLLRVAGLEVRGYLSAEAFLADAARARARFVVADIQLRGISGFELQSQFLKERPGVPFAFITAHDEADVRAQAKAAGCVIYLRKPFKASSLIEAIKQFAIKDTN
jgi:FixJ family two-component response regulator